MGTLSVEANNNHRGKGVWSKTGYHGDTAGSAPWYRLVGTLVLGCLLALLRLLRPGSSSARKAGKKKRAKKIEVLPFERKGEPNLADCSTNTIPIDSPTAPNSVTKSALALTPQPSEVPEETPAPAASALHSAPCVCRPLDPTPLALRRATPTGPSRPTRFQGRSPPRR